MAWSTGRGAKLLSVCPCSIPQMLCKLDFSALVSSPVKWGEQHLLGRVSATAYRCSAKDGRGKDSMLKKLGTPQNLALHNYSCS